MPQYQIDYHLLPDDDTACSSLAIINSDTKDQARRDFLFNADYHLPRQFYDNMMGFQIDRIILLSEIEPQPAEPKSEPAEPDKAKPKPDLLEAAANALDHAEFHNADLRLCKAIDSILDYLKAREAEGG